ncbi:ubiquinol-cytochrome C chaperone family protein [Citromicrobium bathyomarinum]|uniref:ubiquinol-cytochrome C chaperone family protein n=1 Tax=Citromicrobium bathyomarinum TaxID=72174 RepID=UPI00315A9B0E
MSFFSRLLGTQADPREAWRPLWHRLVAEARQEHWYAERGAADTLDGRFDMISMLTALFMLRLENDPEGVPAAARLTELFVEDMEGQMREAGIGDPTVGKMMGRMMATLGGRAGSLRDAMAREDNADLAGVVERNMHLSDEDHGPERIAQGLRALHARLARTDFAMLERGEIAE